MSGKLTQDEIEYGGKPIAGKAWSEEARAAALAARRANARSWHAANTDRHTLSGEAHNASSAANKKPSRESHRLAAEAHGYAAMAHRHSSETGSQALAKDHIELARAHQAEAAKPKPGKVNRDRVRDAGSDDSTRGHDRPLAGEQFKPKEPAGKKPTVGKGNELTGQTFRIKRTHASPGFLSGTSVTIVGKPGPDKYDNDRWYTMRTQDGREMEIRESRLKNPNLFDSTKEPAKKPLLRNTIHESQISGLTAGYDRWAARQKKPKKSFYACGDAVELKTAPGQRLLVIDAGIDERQGPWVAVRETRPGVAGADQKRFVVKPDALNTID